ncbi:hypothetical protein KC19_7G100200 [Ceratodon purpureus]|uniref:Uncharacterized protein n=1 Tax=Ceratodon purpureus TaxID=3225 RepID=A0A8T0H9E1_CERPU|nr:hypothetical protein KC19_7G100200 [Ceratodon purpureus]
MARGLALLLALCLFTLVLAFHVEARVVPDMFDCGPLDKHRFRCDPPLTRNIQADPGQIPHDLHDTSGIEDGDELHVSPTRIGSPSDDGRKEEITNSGTSGDGVEVVAALPSAETPTSGGLDCGPLGKHRFRCDPPLTGLKDINALG